MFFFLDEFDFVVIWIGDEGNYGFVVFYWIGFVGDCVVFGFDCIIGGVGIVYFDGDVVVVGV